MKPGSLALTALVVLLAASASHAGEGSADPSQRISLPPMQAPLVDGVFGEDEWAGAARIQGFGNTGGQFFLRRRGGRTLVGYDREALYLGVVTELPPDGRLVTSVLRDDKNVVYDDSIEIWIDPNRQNRRAGTGDRRYYQIIINDAGRKLDVEFDLTKGVPNTGWDLTGHVFRTRVDREANAWTVEMAIPWTALGVRPELVDGREVGLLLARNWKRGWEQGRYLPSGGFGDWSHYPVFTLAADGPLVREVSLGPVFEGRFDYRLEITNTTDRPQTYKVSGVVDSSNMPSVAHDETLTVPARGAATYALATAEGQLHTTGTHRLSVQVTGPDGTTHFVRSLGVQPVGDQAWEVRKGPAEFTGYRVFHYPSLRKLRVSLDLRTLDGGEAVRRASVEMLGPNGQRVAAGEMDVAEMRAEKVWDVPSLDNGEYTVRATLHGEGTGPEPLEATVFARRFPWEGNALGMQDRVYPPFTPIEAEGRVVRTVLRQHVVNGFGLWDSVVSQGRELLARPMTLEYEAGGEPGQWLSSRTRLVDLRPTSARYESDARGDSVSASIVSTMEEDGCMKVEMTLEPGARAVPIDRLWVEIPLANALAPLWHVMFSGGIRHNPVGAAPAGNGLVWDSTRTGNGDMLGTFLPYIWLGGPSRGLAWFADNDRNWSIEDDRPAQTLHREGGELVLRVHLVNAPTTIDSPRRIVFGLQASPTKPMPKDFRTRTDVPMHGGACLYWGMKQPFSSKYPIGRDYDIVDEMLAARIAGRVDNAVVDDWIESHLKPTTDDPAVLQDRINHIYAGINWVARTGDHPQLIYFEEHYTDHSIPEYRAFGAEWTAEGSFVKSYQDFALWHAMQWMTRGFGLYCDNCFPRNCYDPLLCDAYVRRDGSLQPSANIWNLREYHKRMWKLKEDCSALTRYPLMISYHMTNGMILPIITWDDINLDNEWAWKTGEEPFPPEVILAEMTGLQTGSYPHALYPVMGGKNAERKRAEWGVRFVHEILRGGTDPEAEKIVREFGYGADGCEVIHYWDEATGDARYDGLRVDVSGADVKWIGLWKPESRTALVTLVNWVNEPRTASVRLAGDEAPAGASWTDAETGEPVDAGAVPLEGWGVRLLVARGR